MHGGVKPTLGTENGQISLKSPQEPNVKLKPQKELITLCALYFEDFVFMFYIYVFYSNISTFKNVFF